MEPVVEVICLQYNYQQILWCDGGDRRGERGNKPPNIIMLRPHSQPELTLNLDPNNQRKQKLFSGETPFPFCNREESRCYGAGRVDDSV
jgi:hypothetical protein